MVCKGLETLTDNTIAGILNFPTSCFYRFYEGIMVAFFIILALILFNKEREEFVKADMISSLGVSAIVTIVISFFGTLVGIIQQDILVEIFAGGMVFIIIWFLKNK